MRRRLIKTLLYMLFVLAVVVVGVEVGVRIWGYSEHYIYDPIYMAYDGAEDIPFVHKPDLRDVRGRGNARLDTDGRGLRSLDPDAPPATGDDVYRIAIMGDSITFGEGVENTADTYCEVLETELDRAMPDRDVEVFNFGVSAYSVREMAATLRRRTGAVEPDLVLMAVIPHDFELARVPVVDKYGYTFNRQASGFVPKDSRFKRLLRNVRLVYVLRDLRMRWRTRDRSRKPTDFETLPDTYRYVADFAACARERGLDYRIVLLPNHAGHRFGVVEEQLVRDGIPYLDLTGLADEFSREAYLASPFDRHPSAAVHRRIGEALAASLAKAAENA